MYRGGGRLLELYSKLMYKGAAPPYVYITKEGDIWASCLGRAGRNQPGNNRANVTNPARGYPTGDGFFLVASLQLFAKDTDPKQPW